MLVSLENLTLLLQQLQDYAFPARQILLLPPAIEDIDLCMKESYICHVKFVEFLYKATRTGIYYICLAPTEWAFTSITDQFPLCLGVTTHFLWRAPHTYFNCELPTKLTGRHITVVNVLQCDCMKAQSVTEFLKDFVLPQFPKEVWHNVKSSILSVYLSIFTGFNPLLNM